MGSRGSSGFWELQILQLLPVITKNQLKIIFRPMEKLEKALEKAGKNKELSEVKRLVK